MRVSLQGISSRVADSCDTGSASTKSMVTGEGSVIVTVSGAKYCWIYRIATLSFIFAIRARCLVKNLASSLSQSGKLSMAGVSALERGFAAFNGLDPSEHSGTSQPAHEVGDNSTLKGSVFELKGR